MVFTRNQKLSKGQAEQQEDQFELVELKPERRTKAIAKESRMDRNAIRKGLRERLVGRARRQEKMIRLDDDAHLSAVAG
jgi:hypothetical protein